MYWALHPSPNTHPMNNAPRPADPLADRQYAKRQFTAAMPATPPPRQPQQFVITQPYAIEVEALAPRIPPACPLALLSLVPF